MSPHPAKSAIVLETFKKKTLIYCPDKLEPVFREVPVFREAATLFGVSEIVLAKI